MRSLTYSAAATLGALLLSQAASAQTMSLDGQTSLVRPLGSTLQASITALPGAPLWLLLDTDPGPVQVLGLNLPVGLSAGFGVIGLGSVPGSGTLDFDWPMPSSESLHGTTFYMTSAYVDPNGPQGISITNGVELTLVSRPQLAGNPLATYPFFEHVAAINRGSSVTLGLDPRYTYAAGKTADVYVVASRTAAQWDTTTNLVDVRGTPQTIVFPASPTSIQQNTFTLDTGTLQGPNEASGSGDTAIGVGYDVVIDFGQDGTFDAEIDMIDGYDDVEAGFYVCRDLAFGGLKTATGRGPYAVTEIIYSGGSFLGQDTYYPTNIASLGQLPLVVVSHGNGHNYQWYDHIGYHLASHGFVVMSHENNTVPGSHTAATTTLTNTDYLLGNLATIGGGALNGHVDGHNIIWIGHSRGGDGVARAYDQLFRSAVTPANYTISDITLVSSMAPVDFGGWDGTNVTLGGNNNGSHPHDANYHLWVAQADADVNGCANAQQTFWYGLHERATKKRQAISLYGVGHGDLHDGGGSSVASGPNLIGRTTTHDIMRGYLLALVSHHARGDVPSRDYLWRQYESFRPVGAPTGSSVVVNMIFQDAAEDGKYVIDDFQDQSFVSPFRATCGAGVSWTVQALVEGRADDTNSDFSDNVNDPFNGFTHDDWSPGNGSLRSDSFASVFQFDGSGDKELVYDLTTAPQRPDMRLFRYLSFRAAQASRHPLTNATLGDLDFTVELTDASGNTGAVRIGAYGGGIEEPYQRNTGPTCGTGLGWNSEYETIRIRLTDFQNDGSGVDLQNVTRVTFRFGPSHGSNVGRIGLDEIELTKS